MIKCDYGPHTGDDLLRSLCGSSWGRGIVRSVGTLPPWQSWRRRSSSTLSQSAHSLDKPTTTKSTESFVGPYSTTVACLSSAMLHVWTPKSQQTRPCSWWLTVMRAGSHRQAGPDLRAVLAAPGSTLSKRMLMLSHFHLYGELRFSGVTGRRNGPSGLRDDDDSTTIRISWYQIHQENQSIIVTTTISLF